MLTTQKIVYDTQLVEIAWEADSTTAIIERGVCKTFHHEGRIWTTISGWWRPNEPEKMGARCLEVLPVARFSDASTPWSPSLPASICEQLFGLQVSDQNGQKVVILTGSTSNLRP
jgi:hypothetical protein